MLEDARELSGSVMKEAVEDYNRELVADQSLEDFVNSAAQWLKNEAIGNDVRGHIEWTIRRAHELGVDSVTKGG